MLPPCSSPHIPPKDKPPSMCHPDEQMLLQELHGSVACPLPIPLIPNTSPPVQAHGAENKQREVTAHPWNPWRDTRCQRATISLLLRSHQEQRVFLLLRKFFFSSCQYSEIFAWLDKTQDSLGNHLVKLLRTVKLECTDNANSQCSRL